jgi:hypothetical protein
LVRHDGLQPNELLTLKWRVTPHWTKLICIRIRWLHVIIRLFVAFV